MGACFGWAWVTAIVLSFIAVLGPFLWYAGKGILYVADRSRRRKENQSFLWYKRDTNVIISAVFSGCFLLSLWILLILSMIHDAGHDESQPVGAVIGDGVVDAFFSSLRAIGVPEHYGEFTENLRACLTCAIPDSVGWQTMIVLLALFLRLAIPVAGGAFVLGAFAQAFPKMRLRFSYWDTKREKYYFSSLTPQSVALAKSVLNACWKEGRKSPILIFTDAYVDDDTEAGSELLLEAKRLGAICLRDDLAHVPKTRFGKRRYFLIEEMESDNLPTLMNLVHESNLKYIQDAKIYLMVQSELHVRLEQNIRQRLMDVVRAKLIKQKKFEMLQKEAEQTAELTDSDESPKAEREEIKKLKALLEKDVEARMPIIIPINAYRNLVQNLLTDMPLYEPLVGTDKKKLSVTILGNGFIGTEAFLATYWMGQMLVSENECSHRCPLDIHVVSKDAATTFAPKIDYINPEILRTCDFAGNDPKVQDDILYWNETEKNEPYCHVEYHDADVKMGTMCEDAAWLQSDYYVVALGSDADNIAVADKLRTCIGQKHKKGQQKSNAVIAYVVYDTPLCEALNEGNRVENGVYARAFGDLETVYSSDNVFMSQSKMRASQAGQAYERLFKKSVADAHEQDQDERQQLQKKKDSDEYDYNANYKNNYKYLSSTARVLHTKYKLFSLGWIKTSLFADFAANEKEAKEMCGCYARVSNAKQGYLSAADEEKRQELERKKEYLAFLEHRRWNAYLRVFGYRYGAVRDDSLKLHPCLVETRSPKVPQGYIYNVKLSTITDAKDAYQKGTLDKLDLYILAEYDVKDFDYPKGDSGQYRTISQILQTEKENVLTESELLEKCQNATDDVFMAEAAGGQEWFVPESVWSKWNTAKQERIELEQQAAETNQQQKE